jgi:Tol biopolymer transport system component
MGSMRRMLFVLGTGVAALVLFTFAPTGDASRLKASGTAIHNVSTTASSAADRTMARLVFSRHIRSSGHGPAHVYVINADGSGRKALTRGPQLDGEVAPSPDGRWIAFMRYRRTAADSVRVMRPDGRGGRRLRLSDAELLVPRPWAANGSRFLVATSKAVFAVDPVSGKSTKLRVRALAEEGYSFAFSPDRRRLLFAHKLGAGGVDVVELASGRTRRVASGSVDSAIWLSDGKRIVYAREGRKDGGLWIVDANGRDSRRLAEAYIRSALDRSPSDRIVFSSLRQDGSWLEAVDADGTNRQVLTVKGPECCAAGTWSPDGDKIAFVRRRKIWVINPDGSGERQLTTSGYTDWVSWLPSTR